MKIKIEYLLFLALFIIGCGSLRPKQAFEQIPIPPAPDYSKPENWAALPQKVDPADSTPEGLRDDQLFSQADVFFLHPTSYLDGKKHNTWNAALNDEKINNKTDLGSILYQASLFNNVGKIYAPRYRQAHLYAFFSKDTSSSKKALDLAYNDIKQAFEYYLEHYNNGRPIILAGHSQGARHLIHLMKDYFDNNILRRKLVVCYALGFPIPTDLYKFLKPCEDSNETGCICSWRSYKIGHEPKFLETEKESIVITNPLDWTTQRGVYSDKSKNKGSVIDNIQAAPVPGLSGAEIYKTILWVDKPKFKGSFLYPFSNFHRGDFNIFYMNVRENVQQRLNAFWKQ
ncbi:MAG: DUF3089 domain-containing protein [Saprospiraceae bacterium]|nr:DUF3089 domain-containing protein [Saprospiraceae bacterium]MBK7738014.1 DUF3089 domain-containing protein [Saprospiraceae bacterium]MBK7913407.1 DUF3089 domain-containing protein [Saprospiraceae bacterium]